MKEDPELYWDNIPRKIHSPPSDTADVPHVRTTEERVAEEAEAERFND